MNTSIRSSVGVLLLVVIPSAACVVPNSKIEGEDRSALLLSGRVSLDLLKDRRPDAPVESNPRRNDFKLTLDFDATNGEGDFTQRVAPGDVISLGGVSFPGPDDVEVDFNLFRAYAAVRAANRFANGLGLDGFVGVCTSELDIELRSATASDTTDHSTWGPIIGGTFSVSPIERLRFFVEGSVNFGFASGVDAVTITSLDVGASVSLCSFARLTGGWRRLTYEAEMDDFVASDLDLELSGPMLALWLSL